MAYWEATIEAFAGLITKPSLKEKLLTKPPFRFLHDVITNTIEATGYASNLYTPTQMDSGNVKEKEERIQYLDMLLDYVSNSIGRKIECRSNKVLAGIEPENTNALLQGLAQAARAHMNGGGQAQPPQQQKAPPQQQQPPAQQQQQQQAADEDEINFQREQAEHRAQKEAKARQAELDIQEAKKRQKPQTYAGAGNTIFPITRPVIQFPPADGNEDYIAKTTRLVNTIIQKPRMNPKLLTKPPLRFLHDIVTATLAATGYFQGVFTPDQLQSENVKETKQKLAFLKTFIDFVSASNQCQPPLGTHVNHMKIAAGLEPEKTNLLLQEMAIAAASGIDNQAVLDFLGGGGAPQKQQQMPGRPVAGAEGGKRGGGDVEKENDGGNRESVRDQARRIREEEEEQQRLQNMKERERREQMREQEQQQQQQRQQQQQARSGNDDDEQEAGRMSSRPVATKRPPKLKDQAPPADAELDVKGGARGAVAVSGLIAEGAQVEEEEDDEDDEQGRADDEEDALPAFGEPGANQDNQGKLVRDIMKAQQQGAAEGGEISFNKLSSGSNKQKQQYETAQKQMEELKAQIQGLCQAANPLGKCIDCVYDDLDHMGKELDKWKQENSNSLAALEREQDITADMLRPLREELETMDQQHRDQLATLHTLQAQVLKNDVAIAAALEMHVTGTGTHN